MIHISFEFHVTFWIKKIISLKKSFFNQTRCFAVFKNINTIRMSQKIIQLLSFKPMSKLAFRTL